MPDDLRAEHATAAPVPSGLRQNAVGDVVIPLEQGEIVALPRLWDFDLTVAGPDGGHLVTAGGLHARVAFVGSTAVVESVVQEDHPRSVGLR
jgi:hypothetical protein